MTGKPAAVDEPVVLIVEDDQPLREALRRLFRTVGLKSAAYASAAELLQTDLPDAPACMVLDVRLPGISGLELQGELERLGARVPIIFITGHGDIPMSVRAMKAGAVDFLTKPFRDQELLDAVQLALQRDRERRELDSQVNGVRQRFELLTARERDIMALVTTGLLNKNVAHQLGLSEVTVKIHRGNVMRKMGAGSLAELVRMSDILARSEVRS
jgi:FixJ family two-component response regulator